MVDLYFPSSTGVSVIAEPGSFFVSSAFSFAVNIISKEVVARDGQDQAHGEFHLKKKKIINLHLRSVGVTFNDRLWQGQWNEMWFCKIILPPLSTDDPSPDDEPEFQYYMNEGVYGSFAGKLTEMQIPTPSPHKVNPTLCPEDRKWCMS